MLSGLSPGTDRSAKSRGSAQKAFRAAIVAAVVVCAAGAAIGADEVRLVGGDTLIGKVTSITDDTVVLQHPVLGELKLARSNVASIVQEGQPAPAPAPASQTPPPAADAQQAAQDAAGVPSQDAQPADKPTDKPADKLDTSPAAVSFWRGWKGAFDVGVNGSDGNTETLSVRAAVGAKRATETMETAVGLSYVYSTDNGEKTKSRGELDFRNDWLSKTSRWGFFADAKIEYDEFQDWDWRLSGHVGPTYAFIKDEKTTLRGRAGVGASYEIGGDDQKVRPEGLIGLDFAHKFSDRQSIFATVEYLPSFSDFPEYRINSKAGYEMLVDPDTKTLLKLGVNDRYDSNPGGDYKKNDIEYFLMLGWEF